MLPAGSRPLRPVVVGEDTLEDTLSGVEPGDGRALDAEAVPPGTVREGQIRDRRPDCVVVDGERVTDCVDVVAACADGEASPPVVLLVDGTPDVAADALAAGATETLPRRVATEDPEVFAEQLRDLVERERARQGFDEIFENVSDGLVVHDPETGEIRDVNEQYCELTGYDREELVGGNLRLIIPEDPVDTFDDALDRIERARTEGPQLFEFEGERKDGSRFVGEVHLSVVDIQGREQVLASVRDVTERRRREREYEQIFNSVNDTIAVIDPDSGEIVDANESLCELLGYEKAQLLGMNPAQISVAEEGYTGERGEAIIDEVVETGETRQTEWLVETSDGSTRWLDIVGATATIGGETRYLSIGRDVTDRHERERTIESLHDATERLQEAETTEAACRRTVEAARDVLGLPLTACWLHREGDTEREGESGDDGDDESGVPRLEPVAATEPVREIDPVAFRPGDIEYAAYREGELLIYDPSERFPENPLDAAIMLPLGEHGMLAAGTVGVSEYDEFVVDAARTLAGHVRTALDRVARAERLRESERRLSAILDRIDEAIFLAPASEINDSDPAADYVSAGYESVYGLSLEAMHEAYEEGFFGLLHPDEYDAYWAFVDGIRDDIAAGDPADSYSREYRIELPDGELRWIHSDYYPATWDDGESKIVVVSRDITARKARERTLESFHDATAELTTADTVDEVGAVAVRAAADVFALPATAVYSYDEESGALEPAAAGPGVEADLSPLDADDGAAWAAFVEERMRRVQTEEAPALAAGPGENPLVVPLGGNGLLAVWHSVEELDPDAANIMAATVEAALNRLRGERRLETRSEELQAQAERARRFEAVTELTQRVEAAITAESSRRGVQTAVCEELTDVAPFEAAWIAEADVGTDRLTPRAVAGIDRDRAEASLDAGRPGDADTHPAYEAWQSGEPAVVDDLVGGRRGGWRRSLLGRGAGSVCAVPLAYGGVTHGVLTIVADEPGAFGDREREVLDQLGTSIGYAITAIERQRALESDDTLELEFRGSDAGMPPARLARELGCRVRHERTVRRQDGSVSVYYTLAGDLPGDVAAAAADTLPGAVETVTRAEGEAVIERRGSSWFGAVVSEYGGVLRRGEATPAEVTLLVELPQETDTRSIVERLQEAFPGLELTAQRQHRETATTPGQVATRLERRLTARQQEALETAHAMGYFEWPRESSGEDVADALDITQPTVNKHIRLGEREVFELLFG